MFAFSKNNYDICPCLSNTAISTGAKAPRYQRRNKLPRTVVSVRCDSIRPKAVCDRQVLGFFYTIQLCLSLKKLAPYCRRTAPSWSRSSKPRRTSAPLSFSKTKSAHSTGLTSRARRRAASTISRKRRPGVSPVRLFFACVPYRQPCKQISHAIPEERIYRPHL